MITKVGVVQLKNESNFGEIALPKNSTISRFFIDSIFNFLKGLIAKFLQKRTRSNLILYFQPLVLWGSYCYS